MLKKIVDYRRCVIIALITDFAVLWILALFFDTAERKLFRLIMSVALIFICYVILRLLYKLVMPNATYEIAKLFYCFFIFAGGISYLMYIIGFVINFPCGFAAEIGALIGIIVSSIHSAKIELRF